MVLLATARLLELVCHAIAKVIAFMAVILFVAVVLLNGWETVARYFFAASSIYTVEVSLVIASLVYFVGYAILLHDDEDVRMGYFVDRLSPFTQRVINVINEIGAIAFFCVLGYGSWGYFTLTSGIPHTLFPFHQGYVVLPVLLGATICMLMTLSRLLRAIANLRHCG